MKHLKFPKEVILAYITKYITDDFKENPDGNWININSVFTNDNLYRMGFNISENYVNDFKLSESWDLAKFIAEYQEVSEAHANKILMSLFMKLKKSGLKFTTSGPKKIDPVDLPEVTNMPPVIDFNESTLRDQFGRKAVRFLIHKGFELKHIQKFKLKYVNMKECWVCFGEGERDGEKCGNCKGSGKNFYYGRIIIPSYENGKLVYYQGRDFLGFSTLRYMNPPLGRIQVVYFYDQLKENDRVFICEGPTDAMTLYDYSATCLMSNRISQPQILKILRKKPKQIVFVPDYDEKESTREVVQKSLNRNIADVKELSDNKIDIGIYRWFNQSNEKDINRAGITKVDESLIDYVSRLKGEVKVKLDA